MDVNVHFVDDAESFLKELAAMKQDALDKFNALNTSLGELKTSIATDMTTVVHAAETLMDGLVAKIGAGANTDPEILAALDAAKSQVDTLKAENDALKAELAAKVTADTPA